ncbi:MAG: seryl-tRNA synthetase, partial [Saprospiraceae bacterium]
MLRVSEIRNHKEAFTEGLAKRNFKQPELIDEILSLDNRRKDNQTEHDECLSEINTKSKAIGALFQSGDHQAANAAKGTVTELKEKAKRLEDVKKEIMNSLEEALLTVPNIPHPTVQQGTSDADNEVIQTWEGELPDLSDEALPHWDIASKYRLMDFEAGVKIAGSGFVLYRGKGAKLERALINFFLDEASAAGYEEILPPHLVNAESAKATGQLPDKEGQMYYCEKDDLYLIPTAEIPVTNIYRDTILKKDELPVKLAGYTPCFRREAGSYGSEVKGLNRVHQFNKVEIVQITEPEKSYATLHNMVEYVEGLLKKLELPYRILRLCGGDLGFTSALTYDFEVYSAAQKKWLEVSSVSNFETFQSNRLKVRYKDENGKNQLAHTLNGSALALARIVACLLENH